VPTELTKPTIKYQFSQVADRYLGGVLCNSVTGEVVENAFVNTYGEERRENPMKISFTTLACPDWPWQKIVDQASRLGYDGIEIRGIEGELLVTKCRPFLPENRGATLKDPILSNI
jgi:hypothetical protein